MFQAHTALDRRLERARSHLSAARRRLLDSIVETAAETCFMSSRELARRYVVHPTTIVRLIQALGYHRFGEFSEDFRQHFIARLSPFGMMQEALARGGGSAEQVGSALHQDLANLQTLRTTIDLKRVLTLTRQIRSARQVLVVGVDHAASLASFLAYALLPLGCRAECAIGTDGQLYHKVRTLNRHDLLVAISFGRGLRATVEAVRRAHDLGVPTFGITDSHSGPIARYCDTYLTAPVTGASYAASYTAPMSLLNIIIAACAQADSEKSAARLRETQEEYRTGARWYQPADAPASPTRR